MKQETEQLARRDFFKKAGVSLGAAGIAVVATTTATQAAQPEMKTQDSVGYQESEHVRTYYDLAKF